MSKRVSLDGELFAHGTGARLSKEEWMALCVRWGANLYVRWPTDLSRKGLLTQSARHAPAAILRAAIQVARENGTFPGSSSRSHAIRRNAVWTAVIAQSRGKRCLPQMEDKLQVLIDEKFPLPLGLADPHDGFFWKSNLLSVFLTNLSIRSNARSDRISRRLPIDTDQFRALLEYFRDWLGVQKEKPEFKDVGKCFWRIEPLHNGAAQIVELREIIRNFLGPEWFRQWDFVSYPRPATDSMEAAVIWDFAVSQDGRESLLDLDRLLPVPAKFRSKLLRARLEYALSPFDQDSSLLHQVCRDHPMESWDKETADWFWSDQGRVLSVLLMESSLISVPELVLPMICNRFVLRKLLCSWHLRNLAIYVRHIPPSTWSPEMWKATRSFIPFSASPWSVHVFLTGIKGYRPAPDILTKILARIPRLFLRDDESSICLSNLVKCHPEIARDATLAAVFWHSTWKAPKDRQKSALIRQAVKLLPLRASDLRTFSEKLILSLGSLWDTIDSDLLRIEGKLTRKCADQCLELLSAHFRRTQLLEFFCVKVIPLCPDRDKAREVMEKGIRNLDHTSGLQPVELGLFEHLFGSFPDSLNAIYENLGLLQMTQPSVGDFKKLIKQLVESEPFAARELAKFTLFVARLEQAASLAETNRKPLRLETAIILG